MSDLESREAFEIVLDKLVEEGRRNATDIEKRVEAERRLQIVEQTLNNVRSDLTTAQVRVREIEAGNDAFDGLYTAAEFAAKVLSETDNKGTADSLLAAVAAAKKFIDPIPF